MRNFIILFPVVVLMTLLQGCSTPQQVDFNDPVLNNRHILLFGRIDDRAAELATQKLLFLDGKSHAPIDLYLQTPGGDMKAAFAIEQVMELIKAPVNTYALSECHSGGAVLLAAGTGKRYAFHGKLIVIHGLKISGNGTPPPEFVNAVQEMYSEFWRRRAHLPPLWLPLPLGSIHVLTAEQALEYGIVDEIVNK